MEEAERAKQEEVEQQQELQEIWSWGAGTDGQLGTGKLEDEHLPQILHLPSLSSVGPISTLACGGAHVIALNSAGRVFTWGRGISGQLGHGEMINSLHPKSVSFLEGYFITCVSAGWSHSGFVSDKGCVFTCGDGSFGQLGHGDYRSQSTPAKVEYFAHKPVKQIACGMRHSLVLRKDCSRNQVYGFGSGKRGQLGISRDRIKSVSLPQVTCGFADVEIVSISANGDHSAALSTDGHLYTWGRSFSGASDSNLPQLLPSSLRFTEAAIGWNHTLILTGDGEVFMLGGNHHGALSGLEKVSTVKDVSGGSEGAVLHEVFGLDGVKVVKIAAGAEHSALVTEGGAIKTWGWGEHGQLGLGNTSDQTVPQSVSLGPDVQTKDAFLNVYCGSGFTYVIRSLFLVNTGIVSG